MLRLYAALLDVQERASLRRARRPAVARRAGRVRGRAGDARPWWRRPLDAGPPALVEAAARSTPAPLDAAVRRWLAGEAQSPVEDYLARAASAPVLEALGAVSALPRAPQRRRVPALRRPAPAVLRRGVGRAPGDRAAPSALLPVRRLLDPRAHDLSRVRRAVHREAAHLRRRRAISRPCGPTPARPAGVPDLGRPPEGSGRGARSWTSWWRCRSTCTRGSEASPRSCRTSWGYRRARHGAYRWLLHRHHALHRVQGLRGRLQGVEPAPRPRAQVPRRFDNTGPARRPELAARAVHRARRAERQAWPGA